MDAGRAASARTTAPAGGRQGGKEVSWWAAEAPSQGQRGNFAQWLLQSYSHPESPSLFTEEGTELQGSRVTPSAMLRL